MIDFHRRPSVEIIVRGALWVVAWAVRLGVPVGCAAVLLRAFPRHVTVDGVSFTVQATVFSRAGLSADTTLGNWEFPHFDGLPIGVHVMPVNVDLLRLTRDASADTPTFVAQLQSDFGRRMPGIVLWLVAQAVVGLIIGGILVAAGTLALRQLQGRANPAPAPPRGRFLRTRPVLRRHAERAGAIGLVVALVSGYGFVSYNAKWYKQSRLTGTLAAVQLFPDQLKNYYAHQSKAYDALGAVIGIQAALQQQIERADTPPTAFNIMFISDVHLAAVYPLVRQYATNFDVKLIINTGDESEFGSRAELTTPFRAAMSALTRSVPMLWIAGNHDSPEVATTMAGIPGVTVLGRKVKSTDESMAVSASVVQAGGLTIAGLPDPRVYGGFGAYGSDDGTTVEKLEKASAGAAVSTAGADSRFDIFATHEPVAAAELAARLPARIRQTNSGHLHAQNSTGQIQDGDRINLIEGSTGAGGLDNIDRGETRPPIEFSIESVAENCQFTKVARFQLNNSAAATGDGRSFGDDVSVSTLYLKEQDIAPDRVCSEPVTVGPPQDLR